MPQTLKALILILVCIAFFIPGLVFDIIAGIGKTGSRYIVTTVDYLEKWAGLN
jgi:hypothetical protein